METDRLNGEELTALVRRVFEPRAEDKALAVIVDLPDDVVPDTERWRELVELWHAVGTWPLKTANSNNIHIQLTSFKCVLNTILCVENFNWRFNNMVLLLNCGGFDDGAPNIAIKHF